MYARWLNEHDPGRYWTVSTITDEEMLGISTRNHLFVFLCFLTANTDLLLLISFPQWYPGFVNASKIAPVQDENNYTRVPTLLYHEKFEDGTESLDLDTGVLYH